MLIKATDPMAYMIKAVYVDDVKQEHVLSLDPDAGWVEVHDQLVSTFFREDDGTPRKMLKWTPDQRPVTKKVKGRIRIEWYEDPAAKHKAKKKE